MTLAKQLKNRKPIAAGGRPRALDPDQEIALARLYIENPRTTMAEIAEVYGISTATASRILKRLRNNTK